LKNINICIVGSGYVGLVTGACLADFGLQVTCVDNNQAKIETILSGKIPFFEPGLDAVVIRNMSYKRLSFSTDLASTVKDSDVIFIAVGTPQDEDGSADLSYVHEVAREIGASINGYKVIVNKSTVPIGTGAAVKQIIAEELAKRAALGENIEKIEYDIVSNPEFLREGSAVYDFTHPDRVVIGSESARALKTMKQVYKVLYLNETPFVETNVETAEMIKYAANSFLAMKIAFINEIANLCDKVGANIQQVANAIGKDGRISPKFLHPGPGYGGSCFPKDTNALASIGRKYDSPVSLIETTIKANKFQKEFSAKKIIDKLEGVSGKTLAILGLAFKQNTDDMRDAPAITILKILADAGATFRVYDPVAMEEAKKVFLPISDKIVFCANEYDAAQGADALVILTEWNQFRNLNFSQLQTALKSPILFDFRNIYKRVDVEEQGFVFYAVGH